jgi:hypothetical protein
VSTDTVVYGITVTTEVLVWAAPDTEPGPYSRVLKFKAPLFEVILVYSIGLIKRASTALS